MVRETARDRGADAAPSARDEGHVSRAHPLECATPIVQPEPTTNLVHPAQAKLPPERWPTREEAQRSLLFSPIRYGVCVARTRSWVPAMVPWRSIEDGSVTPDILDWYGRLADGRPGVIVVEATGIRDVPSGPLLRIGGERFVPGLSELTRVVRERSGGATRLFVQIIDFLGIRRRPEKEKYLRRFLVLREEHRAGLRLPGASDEAVREALLALPHERLLALLSPREREDLEFGARERVTDTHLPHIAELPRVLPELFADAAQRARLAGFDGVELHYAHAYTMASFLSRTNTRADGYGGSPKARVRLPLEVLAAVRTRVGSDFTVGCRLLGDEVIEGGSRVEDAAFYATELARAGIDFVSVSKGGRFEDAKQPKVGEAAYPYTGPSGQECMPTRTIDARGPFGRNLELSRAIRAAVRAAGFETPIGGAGGINSFELAERALREADCDFVAAARQSLADPDWWRKMETGRGSQIRRCIFSNYCEALDQRHKQVTCQLWDRDFDAPDPGRDDVARSSDAKRRLVPPPWVPQ
ncbi:MAG: NADH:flavin oxidoreductase [Planctomycetes bacterium]|nr:NADH:flavin oxidoreductase [Planctomycetota bacterium]